MTKFKVGDRVRYVGMSVESIKGQILTIAEEKDWGCRFGVVSSQGPRVYWCHGISLELVSETQINSETSLECMQARIDELDVKLAQASEHAVRNLERWQKAEGRIKELEALLTRNRMRFEDLEATIVNNQDTYELDVTAYDQRNAELSTQVEYYQGHHLTPLIEVVEFLRAEAKRWEANWQVAAAQLAESDRKVDDLFATCEKYRKELYEPKLVKQTWQNLYSDRENGDYWPTRFICDNSHSAYGTHIAVLRRDTYRNLDGTTYTTATLEGVEE